MSQPQLPFHRRAPEIQVSLERGFQGELVVDNFAGGGGVTSGIEAAIGRAADIAINHDPVAIAMHRANHPDTKHFVEDIWDVDPVEACGGRPVGLAWFSPDCKHFSRAKGDVPKDSNIRGLAWMVVRWAYAVKPRIIVLENVPEFKEWGPLALDGRPDKSRAGETFREWCAQLRGHGYSLDFRELVAADYGAPTIRRRLFMIARRDRAPIVWPEATHGAGCAEDWRTAAEIIDWSLPCPSIFERSRPLAEATQYRIAEGIRRYVIEAKEPFIVRHGHYSKKTGAGLRPGCGAGLFRGQRLVEPLATICATNDKDLVIPVLTKHYGGVVGHEVTRPLGAITARDSHALTTALLRHEGDGVDRSEQVTAFLMKYYGSGSANHQDLRKPLHTIRTRDCFSLVEVHGRPYRISDIGMRMLAPHELYAGQGFPADYEIERHPDGRRFTKTEQIRLVGNSVAPPVAQAIVAQAARAA